MGLEEFFYSLANQFGFLGVFLFSFLGASSILIPIPYQIIVFWLSGNPNINPFILIVSASLGSAVGELVGYFAGYVAKNKFGERSRLRFDAMLKVLMKYKNIWPLLIFIFAFTPLPDDLLFIPMGLIRFSFISVFIPCIAGKLVMFSLIVLGGKEINFLIESYIGRSDYLTSLIFTVATVVILSATIIVMWKFDWGKLLVGPKKFYT